MDGRLKQALRNRAEASCSDDPEPLAVRAGRRDLVGAQRHGQAGVAAWDAARAPALNALGLPEDPSELFAEHAQELVLALRRAVDDDLSERQRAIFVAIVLNEVPLDALVAELGSNRNAIYKSLFDARRKLRARLVADGHLDLETARRP